MKMKFKVVEESITDYLTMIGTDFHEYAPKELKKQARILTGDDEDSGYIPKYMSTDFNPNLFISGQEEEFWELYSKTHGGVMLGGKVTEGITVTYTGMRLHEVFSPGEAKVWSEFGVDGGQYELERDYAYFQETGIDPIADPKYAKHMHAVELGTKAASNELLEHSKAYLYNIMRGGKGDIPPKLI